MPHVSKHGSGRQGAVFKFPPGHMKYCSRLIVEEEQKVQAKQALLSSSILIAAYIATFGACNDDTTGTGGGGAGVDISDVIFDMEGGDEALRAVLDAEVAADDAEVAVIDAPAPGEAVPSSPFTFRWHVGTSSSALPSAAPVKLGRLFDPSELVLKPVLAFALSGVRPAHAHGPPVNGRVHFLVLATDDDPTLMRVFTQATEFTPDDAAWDKIAAAGGPITATVLSAELETNRVLQGGGPWLSEPVTFTVAE